MTVEEFEKATRKKVKNGVEKGNESGIINDIEVDGKAELKRAIQEGKIKLEINPEKQNRHIKGTKEYVEGKSYLTISMEEAQRIVDARSGTGKIAISNNGMQFKESVICDKIIGVAVNSETLTKTKTNKVKIHYSKTGTHIVPIKE